MAKKSNIEAIPQDEIDAVLASRGDTPANDIEKSGRIETAVETNTVVEDRTSAPVEDAAVEYEVSHMDLDGGTVLSSYGEPVGGRPSNVEAE